MSTSVLVIGGGISGIKATLDLGKLGVETILIEQKEKLGGTFENLGSTFPYGVNAQASLKNWFQILHSLRNVKIYMNTLVKSVVRVNDGFKIIVDTDKASFIVGAIIVATGFTPFDATKIPNYHYGKYKNVINSLELVQMLRNGQNLVKPSDNTPLRKVSFITCVGSRDKKTNDYCSSFCCAYTVHLAKMVKELDRKIDVTIMYMDMRTFSNYEALYQEARSLGVKFLRGKPSIVFKDKNSKQISIQVENTITREFLQHKTDLVVLSIGAEPADGNDELGRIMKLLKDERTGFFTVSNNDDVSAVEQERIFIIGNASGPKDSQYSLAQASAAALKAIISIKGLNF